MSEETPEPATEKKVEPETATPAAEQGIEAENTAENTSETSSEKPAEPTETAVDASAKEKTASVVEPNPNKNVLTKEEVDALLNATRGRPNNLDSSSFLEEGKSESWQGNNYTINEKLLNNINRLFGADFEEQFATFLRTKITANIKSIVHARLSECLANKMEKHVYCVFHFQPHDTYGMIAIDSMLLNNIITVLFGGKINADETVVERTGKIGIIIAEQISKILLDCFAKACGEYGQVTYEIVKIIAHPNLTSKLSLEDRIHMTDMAIYFGEMETAIALLTVDGFYEKFIPAKTKEVKHVESNFWRSAIETQLSDSYVTLNATLSDIHIKVNELLKLKAGDLIPIGDPTIAYVCLNQVKLYRANAGQANSKRVAKILSEI